MDDFKTRFLYAFYILTVTFFFLVYLFPTDTVKDYVLYTINRTCPEINLQTSKILPAFPVGLTLKAVKLYHRQNLLIDADQIIITPRLWSLFSPPVKLVFKGRAYGGIVKGAGKFTTSPAGSRVAGRARLAGIHVTDISALRNLSGRKITGVLDGDLTYDISSESGSSINAELTLSDCEIELLMPIFNLNKVTFKKIESLVSLNNRNIRLKQCTFKGAQMDGTITGSITLNNPLKDSVIKLSGTFTPQPVLLARLSKVFPVNRKRTKPAGFPVTLGGTLDKPNFFLK